MKVLTDSFVLIVHSDIERVVTPSPETSQEQNEEPFDGNFSHLNIGFTPVPKRQRSTVSAHFAIFKILLVCFKISS